MKLSNYHLNSQLIVIITIKGNSIIICLIYLNRCDGGYPFLVQKFASENELVTEECHPYIGMTGRCEMMCDKNLEAKTYKVTNYRFIGG